MKKNLLTIIKICSLFLIIVILPTVKATWSEGTTGVIAAWGLDTSSAIDDHTGTYNGSISGATFISSDCKLGSGCFNFSGDQTSGDYITFGYSPNWDGLTNYTISLWIKPFQKNNYQYASGFGKVQSGTWHVMGLDNTGNFYSYSSYTTPNLDVTGDALKNNTHWYHYLMVYNTSDNTTSLYANNTLQGTDTYTDHGIVNGQWQLGRNLRDGANLFYFSGIIDEVVIWNRTLNSSERSDLYNSGSGIPYPFSGFSINISDPLPLDDTQFNTINLSINITVNASLTFNTTLYVNDTINQTINDTPSGNNRQINFSLIFPSDTEETHTFIIGVNDGTTNKNSTSHTIHIDNLAPQITSTNYTGNGTIILLNNLTGQFNFSDSLLLNSYNISIDGTTIDNLTGLGVANYTYNLSYNVSNLSIGSHILTVTIADGHTRRRLRGNYTVDKGLFDDWIRFNVYNNVWAKITPEDGSILDNFDYNRKVDRYTFDYQPWNDGKDNYTFLIESNKPITIIDKPDSKYKKWLTIGEHWLDFVPKDEPGFNIDITRENRKKVYVTISNITNKANISFESIGDLNILTQNYTFQKTNGTVTYNSHVVTMMEQTITFDINLTANITSTEASIIWNSTSLPVVKTSTTPYDRYTTTFNTPLVNSETNVSFFWFYNITGVGSNETGNFTNNQTVVLKPLNVTIRDQTTNNLITTATAIDVTTNSSLTNFSTSVGTILLNLTGVENQLDFSNPDYENARYFYTPINNDNTTEYLTVYMLNNTQNVNITVLVKTESNALIQGARLNFTRLVGGSIVTVVEKITDISGSVAVSLDPDITHTVYVSATGYNNRSAIIEPNVDQSPYTITLTSTEADTTSYYIGLNYNFTPIDDPLTNRTNITMGFNVTSSFWTITDCFFQVQDQNLTTISSNNSFCSDTTGFSTLTINTSNNTSLTSIAILTLNGTNITITRYYSVTSAFQGEFSLMTLIDDINNFSGSGFGDFNRSIIALIIIAGVTIIAMTKTDFLGEPGRALFLVAALTTLMCFVGWLTIPFLDDPTMSRWGLAILVWVLAIVNGLIEWRQT
jgi:hypothetical protein